MKKISRVQKIVAVVLVGVMLCGCGVITQETANNDELSSQIEQLNEKVDKLQKTIDSYYGTVDNQSAKCSVTEDQITYDSSVLSDQLLITLTNNGSEAISNMDVDVIYYDESGNMMSMSNGYLYNVFPNVPMMVGVSLPVDQAGVVVDYSSFEVQFDISNEVFTGVSQVDQVEISDNKGSDGQILVKAKNNGSQDIQEADIQVAYYLNGQVVGVSSSSIYDLRAGKEQIESVYGPTDWNGNSIEYDDYKLSLTGAYSTSDNVESEEINE